MAPGTLFALNENKSVEELRRAGGVEGLAQALCCSPQDGVRDDPGELEQRRNKYGSNCFRQVPGKNFFLLWFENLKDPTIVMLMAAALISTIIGAAVPSERKESAWTEGVAIWVAVAVVSLVGAGNDWQKDRQFRKLNAQKDVIEVSVTRSGRALRVQSPDLVVGDVIVLDTGDRVPADAILILGHGLSLDEASLTGESEAQGKERGRDPWLRCGTQVVEGSGSALVVAVGEASEWGRTMSLVRAESGDTPLQEKLGVLAAAVGKMGLAVGVLCFFVLLIRWMVEYGGFPLSRFAQGPLQYFIFAVTIVVVAVPEGLPLAVTISLAYSMTRMVRDNNFVRVLAACETMGGATTICSDKTGTLTQNRMTVTAAWIAGRAGGVDFEGSADASDGSASDAEAETRALSPAPPRARSPVAPPVELEDAIPLDSLPPALARCLVRGVALNSRAFLTDEGPGGVGFVGNRTECALLVLLRRWGLDERRARADHEAGIARVFGFTSERKMSSVVEAPSGARGDAILHCKGAAEVVLARCSRVAAVQIGHEGEGRGEASLPPSRVLDSKTRAELEALVTGMASRGLRTLALAARALEPGEVSLEEQGGKRDEKGPGKDEGGSENPCSSAPPSPPEEDLTLLAVLGIKDPLRPEVAEAVRTCQRAGIAVRMVTGDNVHTARHIARECGILSEGDGVLEGPVFRSMSRAQVLAALPRLRVLARSTPQDKHALVSTLRQLGEVVAVTGDGTNDAPALKESDVGLAMGLAGTEVAKEAADIVILDDNFSSIVKSVLWGRSVFANIRKFLQFQLTINVVALVVAFTAAVSEGETPLNVLQLLWVNLIMDSLAALALATERPQPSLLEEPPAGRSEALISPPMARHIGAQALYQVFWLLLIFYGAPAHLEAFAITSECDGHPAHPSSSWTEAGAASCLQAGGGFYLPGEPFVCALRPDGGCDVAEPAAADYCGGDSGGCERYTAVLAAAEAGVEQYKEAREQDRRRANSLVFNTFIWLQLFNLVNSRCILHEYNVFRGLLNSPIFVVVLAACVGAQLIIMFFLGGVFKVERQSWQEWLFALAIGAGGLAVSAGVKALAHARGFAGHAERRAEQHRRRQEDGYTDTSGHELYRRHWWQLLKPAPPKDLRERWKAETRALREERGKEGGPVARLWVRLS